MNAGKSLRRVLMVWFLVGFVAGIRPGSARSDSLRDRMIAQAKNEKQFIVGGPSGDNFRDELVGFKKLYPFITIKVFTGNSADVTNRVFAEAQAGKLSIDMVASSSESLELIAKGDLLTKMEYPHLKDFQAGTQPRSGAYVQGFLNPRVQGIYNTDLVPPGEVPKSWEDMLDPKWNGKTMLSRTAEDIPAHLAYLWREGDKLNWDRAFDFFRKLEKQKPIIARGARGGTQRVAAGEAAILWFISVGPAGRLAAMGAPMGLVAFPKFTGTFRSYGILKGARNPASSWLFIDYLTSPEGQFEYTEVISAKVPVNKKAKVGKLGRWMVAQGATVENTVAMDAEVAFDEKIIKKSEDFFLKLIGIK
ncbi:MAG: extracellular solute-binding protein [Desulfobacterales bacterium]|nr:extracellular solute-binding protein [Desulfobacterales bacterium]